MFCPKEPFSSEVFHFGAQGQHDMKCCLKYLAEEKGLDAPLTSLQILSHIKQRLLIDDALRWAHNWLTSSGLTDEGKIVSLFLEAFAEKYNNVENSLEIHTRLMNFKKTPPLIWH